MMVRLPTIVLVYFKKMMRDQSSVLHVRTWPKPKAVIWKPHSQLSQEPNLPVPLSWASRAVKNKRLSFKKKQSLVFCYSSPSWLIHWGDDYYVNYSLGIPQILFSYWYFFHKNIFLLFSVCSHFNMIV